MIETMWQRPEIPPDQAGGALDSASDFWIEGLTAGFPGGATYMDGRLLHGVTDVSTVQGVDRATKVTITFIARTLNKGERPESGASEWERHHPEALR